MVRLKKVKVYFSTARFFRKKTAIFTKFFLYHAIYIVRKWPLSEVEYKFGTGPHIILQEGLPEKILK